MKVGTKVKVNIDGKEYSAIITDAPENKKNFYDIPQFLFIWETNVTPGIVLKEVQDEFLVLQIKDEPGRVESYIPIIIDTVNVTHDIGCDCMMSFEKIHNKTEITTGMYFECNELLEDLEEDEEKEDYINSTENYILIDSDGQGTYYVEHNNTFEFNNIESYNINNVITLYKVVITEK